MALLELLALATTDSGLTASVAHIDHLQRTESQAEADLVRQRAEACWLRFTSVRIEYPGAGSEADLRDQRYAALRRIATEHGADRIATGHTADDQIETLLMRLLRGAGRRGMAGIPAVRGAIVRPLLAERREDLRHFLVERGIDWIEDPSNGDSRFTRNRVRLHVVPLIGEQFGADALSHLPKMAARWSAEESYLESESARYLAFASRGDARQGASALDLAAFDRTPEALKGRVLKRWAEAALGGNTTLSLRQLEALEQLVAARDGTRRRDLAGSQFVREYGRLRINSNPGHEQTNEPNKTPPVLNAGEVRHGSDGAPKRRRPARQPKGS